MKQGRRFGLSAEQKLDVWRRWKAGQTLHEIGRAFDKPHSSIRCLLLPRGGIPPAARRRSRLALTLVEREDISRGMASGSSLRNLVLFRSINHTELVRGHIEYGRSVVLRASSWECFAFSGFFLTLFAFTRSWFILGGAVACFSLGVKHRRLAGRLHTNLARTAQSPQQT
jgi:hypothetical protein